MSRGADNQRRFERYRGRIPCRLKVDGEERRGFVTDLSASGLFVETRSTVNAGTKVVLDLDGPSGEPMVVTGSVSRERRSHRSAASVVIPGFGVALDSAPETYFRIVADLDREG